jgi:small-conductance mechanosensitive channel
MKNLKPYVSIFSYPLLVIALSYVIYYFAFWAIPKMGVVNMVWQRSAYIALQIIVFACIAWLFIRFIKSIQAALSAYFDKNNHKVGAIVAPFIANSLKAIILLSLVSLLVDFLPLPSQYIYLTDKLTSILIIAVIAWILLRLIDLTEHFIILHYNICDSDSLLAQKARTQIIIIKRILVAIVFILTIGSILMLFENVRELGTSILASAGIAGAIALLATQKYFTSLIYGLQIALNQPIKINDYVVLENEFGQIEEITLTYVIVKIWDLRRLIVPINYFIEKPFQNLSRKSTNIMGTVFLYVDYTLPLAALKEKLTEIVNASPFWDKSVCNLQVTDAKENCMELRILVSARNPGDAWNLRCEVREKLVQFILEHYPKSWPRRRLEMERLGTIDNSQ